MFVGVFFGGGCSLQFSKQEMPQCPQAHAYTHINTKFMFTYWSTVFPFQQLSSLSVACCAHFLYPIAFSDMLSRAKHNPSSGVCSWLPWNTFVILLPVHCIWIWAVSKMKFSRKAAVMPLHWFSKHLLNADSRLGPVLRVQSTKIKTIARGQYSIMVIKWLPVVTSKQ